MSGWLGIIALLITTVGGSFGVTYLNNRKELLALKLKMQAENDDKVEKRLKEYVTYVEDKLDRSNKRFDTLYEQYVKLQGEAMQRETDLQSERQKTINAVHELGIVKKEYEALKAEFIAEKKRLEEQNSVLTAKCNALSAEYAKLLSRVAMLEKGQCDIVEELHTVAPTTS